jgi:hypothetical protein
MNNANNKKTTFDMLKGAYTNSENAKKISFVSLGIAALAFIASSLSVYFSYQDSISDERWQKAQIELISKLVMESSLGNEQYSKTHSISEAELTELKRTNELLLEILKKPLIVGSKENKDDQVKATSH